jgi:hypothetical protein
VLVAYDRIRRVDQVATVLKPAIAEIEVLPGGATKAAVKAPQRAEGISGHREVATREERGWSVLVIEVATVGIHQL